MSQRFLTPPEDRRICETKREPAQVLKHQELRHLRRRMAGPTRLLPSYGPPASARHSSPVTRHLSLFWWRRRESWPPPASPESRPLAAADAYLSAGRVLRSLSSRSPLLLPYPA